MPDPTRSPCERVLGEIIHASCSRDPGLTAQRLIAEFGTLPAVLAGSPRRQCRAARGDLAAVQAVRRFNRAMQYALRRNLDTQPLISTWQALLDYLHADLAHRSTEHVRILYLNSRNRLIKDELAATGTIDECAVHIREIIARAIELGAASLILAHNHPGGDPSPSRADIDLTRHLMLAGKHLGIAVHDHLVLSASGHASMRALGLI